MKRKVTFHKVQVFIPTDPRRTITDITLPEDLNLPFEIRQIKLIDLTEEGIKKKMGIGNHYHTEKSNRWEFFVSAGEIGGENLLLFRFRNFPGGKMEEVPMRIGDACLIPPGCSHSFLGLVPGVKILGISNLPYDSAHDVTDKLFQ